MQYYILLSALLALGMNPEEAERDTLTVKTISIWQPWATLLALGLKGIETRSWATKHRGPIAIHAARKLDLTACATEPIRSLLAAHGYSDPDQLPRGSVLAIGNLINCKRMAFSDRPGHLDLSTLPAREQQLGWYAPGRYAWEIGQIQQFEVPIPALGKQGIWSWEGARRHGAV